ncbi:MAG: sensor histidine kinase, partial [Spirochaetota bacterium]
SMCEKALPGSGAEKLPGRYTAVSGGGKVYFYFVIEKDGGTYCVGFDYIFYRRYIHSIASVFAFLYLLSVFIIAGVFPILFRISFLNPMMTLMDGARIVKEGNLSLQLPVRYDDEIGFLTAAFNEMVVSLEHSRGHQEHYQKQLEDAFLKIEDSQKDIEGNLSELRVTHEALQESEQRYRELNADLELRVAERTALLEKTNIELSCAFDQLRQTHDELIRNEKMAALGDMVAGVAHEINTPVGIALTASSHLETNIQRVNALYLSNALTKSELERSLSSCEQSASIIMSNLLRAGDLIQSFKLVASDQSSEQRRIFDIGEYMNGVLTSLQPKLKRTSHRVDIFCAEGISLYSYPGAFCQILTNLVMNSLYHAYPDKDGGQMRCVISKEDDLLVISYTDDGCGIEKEILAKIFDPFFTTRRHNGGTGLGLHIVHNIVTQKLMGSIDVRSEPGNGVRFVVRLPLPQMTLPEQL